MEILKNFGLDPYLTIAQIVNFLVILYILKRFLYPPLFKVLKKRQDLAKEAIAKAQESKEVLEKAQQQEQEIVKKAKITADQIIKDAKEQASDVIKQAEDEAKKRTDEIVQSSREQIAREAKDVEAKLSKQVGGLSLELLRKSITGIFTEKEQEAIMKKALSELGQKPL